MTTGGSLGFIGMLLTDHLECVCRLYISWQSPLGNIHKAHMTRQVRTIAGSMLLMMLPMLCLSSISHLPIGLADVKFA